MAPLAMEFVSARARSSACQDSVLARPFTPFTPNTRAAPSGQGAREDGLLALRQAVHGPQAQAPLGTRSSTDLRASEATSGQVWRGLSATRTPSPVSAARTPCPPWRLERHPRFRGSNAVPTLAAQTPGQPSAAWRTVQLGRSRTLCRSSAPSWRNTSRADVVAKLVKLLVHTRTYESERPSGNRLYQ